MPGIFGVIGVPDAGERREILGRMQHAMLHEVSYTSGVYEEASLGLGVGWVAHRGSFADCMPVWDDTGNICLVFAGEDFGDDRWRYDPGSSGRRCDSGKASYLVKMYERRGPAFVDAINGLFSGMVVDRRDGTSFLFNDRYGLQRVYYHESATGFIFASEAKALLKAVPSLRRVDFASLGETFSLGCVLQNRTLFQGIALLPGGSRWTFSRGGQVRRDSYFSAARWEELPRVDGAEFYDRLKEIFSRVLPRYCAGPPAVGMSLTGGLDGRMIMAWAKPAPGSMPCYSFSGTYRECADTTIARRISALLDQPHETIIVGSDFFPLFPALAEKAVYVSDGSMDVTGAVELYVNAIAREIAPVRLTGNYGSEIIRGNVAFRPGAFPEQLLASDFSRLVRDAATTYANEQVASKVSFVAFKQVPWYHYSRFSVEQSQLTLRSPYLDNELVALMHQAPQEVIASAMPSLRLIADGDGRLATLPTDRGVRYRPIPGLTRLSRFYREFTAKAEYAYDYGMPQWLVRIDHTLAPLHLERLFLGRHKFYHFRVWYRDRFSQYLKDVLLDSRARSRPYLNGKALERMVSTHVAGTANYTSELHRILTAELFHRTLIDAGA